MKLEVTKTIEYTFDIEVDPGDYKAFQEYGEIGHLEYYINEKDPAYDFKHDVSDITVFNPEDI